MQIKELVRWGVPLAVFVGFVKLSGAGVALLFAGVLFALISAAIAWHARDPKGFFVGIRAWLIVLLVVPAALVTVGAALAAPAFLIVAAPFLLLAIWLYKLNGRKIEQHNLRLN